MPGVARKGIEHATGGVIIGPSSLTVFVNGFPMGLLGDIVAPHAPCPDPSSHCAASVIQGDPTVYAGGVQIARIGDMCSCGHSLQQGSKVDVYS